MQSHSFLYQINVTRDCNLRCTHCYISSEKKASSKYMTPAQITDIVLKIADHIEQSESIKHAVVHLIGGEPTLLGLEMYSNLIPELRAILSRPSLLKKKVEFSIVTNLLNNESVDIALLFDHVATSYEVATRFTKSKQEQKWVDNVALLMARGMTPTVTCAITQQAIDFGAVNYIEHLLALGFKAIHFGFFIPSGDGKTNALTIFPRFEATSSFLIDVAAWYIAHQNEYPDVIISPVETLISSIYNNEPSEDIICPIIPGSLDFDWNGETRSCIESGGEVGAPYIGNVFDKSVIELTNTPEYRRERAKALRPPKICSTCDELNVCQSGCGVLHGYWSQHGECPGYKQHIKYVRSQVEQHGVAPREFVKKVISC